MKLAVVGVTGLVGRTMLQVLEKRNFPVDELVAVASPKSEGKEIVFKQRKYKITGPGNAVKMRPDIALFSAGSALSLEWAPRFAEAGTTVIDNSSAWRMTPDIKLIVPEANGGILTSEDRIIANPNCSTIQMVVALAPLHRKFGIKRIVVSTYQAVTGAGQKGVAQLAKERSKKKIDVGTFPYPIDLNVIPQVDVFMDNGYTKEEMKMVDETRKILDDSTIAITATTVRVPVTGGHSESVNVELLHSCDLDDVVGLLSKAAGVTLINSHEQNKYPMPRDAEGKDDVFVGRIRTDESQPNTFNLWIVSDNLRKGAATNAVQIAEQVMNLRLRI